jgi:chromosome segregation ATPase
MGRWRSFFHPADTWRRYEAAVADLNAALERERTEDSRVATLDEENRALKARVETLEEELRNAQNSAAANMHELLRTRREYDDYRHSSADKEEVERQVKEITSMVEKVEGMKAQYERRIRILKHALADAKAILKDRSDYDALHQLSVIDMNNNDEESPRRDESAADNVETDEMKTQKHTQEYYTPSLFDEFEENIQAAPHPDLTALAEPTRDWLQPLPED